MTRHGRRRPDLSVRRWWPTVLMTSALVAVALASGWAGAGLLGLAVVVAGCMLLHVQLPRGGSVPVGHAMVIALIELLSPLQVGIVILPALALLVTVAWARQAFPGTLAPAVVMGVASVTGILAREVALASSDFLSGSSDLAVLGRVVIIAAAYFGTDLVGRGRVVSRGQGRAGSGLDVPAYVALLSAAALLAVAYRREGLDVALVAAVPLLLTWFSFQRSSVARNTYRQTTQALSMLPEVAGLSPLGHGERTAAYAQAMAATLGYEGPPAERMATAARLHHIGFISADEPGTGPAAPDPAHVGRVGGEILEETGFLADVSELVEAVQAAPADTDDVRVAIVRVASDFDDVVGDQPDLTRNALIEVLAHHDHGAGRRAAIALLQACEERPDLAEDVRRRVAPVTARAAGAGHRPDSSGGGH